MAFSQIGTSSAPLTAENPGGRAAPNTAEIVGGRYLTDPNVTFWSYAAGAASGCGATMIGPRIAMTAAHCGASSPQMTFTVYRDGSKTNPVRETVTCPYLLQAFDCSPPCSPVAWHGDVLFLDCPQLSGGLFPGDKYGYVNFDTSAPPTQQTSTLYSIWPNPINNIPSAAQGAMLYSEGWVADTNGNAWNNQAIDMTMWGAPGASGSAHFSLSNHRVIVGPVSTAPGGNGGASRRAMSVRELFNYATVDGNGNNALNNAQIQRYGLNPTSYIGLLDKNRNTVFDIQEDVERTYGETQRDHVRLGFENHRRNALWSVDPSGVSFAPSDGLMKIIVTSPTAVPWVLARHERLNLKPNTWYRLTLQTWTRATGSLTPNRALEFQLYASGLGVTSAYVLDTSVTAGYVQQTFRIRTASRVDALRLRALDTVDISLAAVNLIEEGSVMNFDTQDKRYDWRNDNNGDRGLILPSGRGNGANWAGWVQRDPAIADGNDFPLRNRQLGLAAGQGYRICFWTRRVRGVQSAGNWGFARLKSASQSGSEELTSVGFSPDDWQQSCLNGVTPPTGDNILQFGIRDQCPTCSRDIAYVVDDITISTDDWRQEFDVLLKWLTW